MPNEDILRAKDHCVIIDIGNIVCFVVFSEGVRSVGKSQMHPSKLWTSMSWS